MSAPAAAGIPGAVHLHGGASAAPARACHLHWTMAQTPSLCKHRHIQWNTHTCVRAQRDDVDTCPAPFVAPVVMLTAVLVSTT